MRPALKFNNYLGFGLGDFAFNLFFQGTTLFLLFFYTDVLGIAAKTAGSIFLIASVWDAISDPIMGYLANKTRSPWGRYRPYLLIAALPLGISYTFLFYRPALSGVALFYWALILQLLFRTFFTMGNIPYSSLSSEMTANPEERSKLAAYRMFFGYAGALSVSYLTGLLMSKMGWLPTEDGYFNTGIVFGLVAAILFTITFLLTHEQNRADHSTDFKLSALFGIIRYNSPFLQLAAYILFGIAGVVFFYQSLAYYFKYILLAEASLGIGMLILFLCLMATLPLWLKISNRYGKKEALLMGCLWLLVSSLAFYFNPWVQQQLYWVYFHLGLIGIGIGCAAFSFWAMLPDTVEFGQWKTGIRAEGMLFGLGLLALKLGLGLGSFLLGHALSFINYAPNAAQSASTLNALHTMTALCIGTIAVIIGIIVYSYPIDRARFEEIVKALGR
jgi:GPH family glycoside/pentoside/hexuronide:cation symporter